MNKFQALRNYIAAKYPHLQTSERHYTDSSFSSSTTVVEYPDFLYNEIVAFFTAWDLGFESGYDNASRRAADEYRRNIEEIVTQMYVVGYNQGFADGTDKGFIDGQDYELEASTIPSDAYDIEVFAVQPSNDFETGQQAFIGYKFDLDGEPQFRFIQVQFAVPNLQTKSKINDNSQKVIDFTEANLGRKQNN